MSRSGCEGKRESPSDWQFFSRSFLWKVFCLFGCKYQRFISIFLSRFRVQYGYWIYTLVHRAHNPCITAWDVDVKHSCGIGHKYTSIPCLKFSYSIHPPILCYCLDQIDHGNLNLECLSNLTVSDGWKVDWTKSVALLNNFSTTALFFSSKELLECHRMGKTVLLIHIKL